MTDITRTPAGPRPVTAGASPPPHPLDSEWYIHAEGHTYGPYPGHQLAEFVKEGRVDGATQVLLAGTETWSRAAEEPRLAAIFRAARAPTVVAPPISAAAGATVVHVTNTVAPAPVVYLDGGEPFGPKSAGVALLLSLLLCGAGQMYCGRVGRGFLMLFGSIALWFILLGWTIWIWSAIDAYTTAKDMNRRYLMRMQTMRPQ